MQKDQAKNRGSGLNSIAKIKQKSVNKMAVYVGKKNDKGHCCLFVIDHCSLNTDHVGHVPLLQIMEASVTDPSDTRHRSWREYSN